MTAPEWITTAAAFTTIVAFIGTLIARIFRGHTAKVIKEITREYLSELKPNHGSSIKDAITKIGNDITDIKVNLATLEGKFTQHIDENSH